MMKRILPFAGCYLACRLAYGIVLRLIPIFSPFSGLWFLLGQAVFWALAFLFAAKVILKTAVHPKRFALALLSALLVSELGSLLEHLVKAPFLPLLFYLAAWLFLTLLLFCKKAGFPEAARACLSPPGLLRLLALFLLDLLLVWPFFLAKSPHHITGGPPTLMLYLDMLTARPAAAPDFLLPQFTFFAWTAARIGRLPLFAKKGSTTEGGGPS